MQNVNISATLPTLKGKRKIKRNKIFLIRQWKNTEYQRLGDIAKEVLRKLIFTAVFKEQQSTHIKGLISRQ